MKRAEISGARTKKVLLSRKLALRKWQARTLRLMSNPKPILRAKCGGEAALLRPALYPPRRQLPAIFSSGSLEYGGNPPPRLRRRLIASVEHRHDEHPTRMLAAVHLVSSASDRTTSFAL